MPRIIFKCAHIKPGQSVHRENLVGYIATREGVQMMSLEEGHRPATAKQETHIQMLLKDFPDTKTLFEYEDYLQAPTVQTASDFITATTEYHLDQMSRKENYVDYIANRPRVEKLSTHGLFNGSGEVVNLSQVVREVGAHQGNVWLPIISLRREDAANTGFDNAQRWQDYLSAFAPKLAEELGIPPDQFRWYAAFHDEGHHPHVHMVCYCANGRQGFLSLKGIEGIKSELVSHIFQVEMKEIYQQQTLRRDALKAQSQEATHALLHNLSKGNVENPKVEQILLELAVALKSAKGKHIYGYLSPAIKGKVDAIVDELAKEPTMAAAYQSWYQLRMEVLHSYSDKEVPQVPLSQQKEFKSIKNMIIREADQLDLDLLIRPTVVMENQESVEEPNPTPTPTATATPIPEVPFYQPSYEWSHRQSQRTSTQAPIPQSTSSNPTLANSVLKLMRRLSQLLEEQGPPLSGGMHLQIDSKRMRKLREMKMAQGHKWDDQNHDFSYTQ